MLLTAVVGEYNYRLPRRALPEVRDLLCALPRNDMSREARNGKVLGVLRILIGGRCFRDNTLGEHSFSRKKKTGQVWRERGHGGESPG